MDDHCKGIQEVAIALGDSCHADMMWNGTASTVTEPNGDHACPAHLEIQCA